MVVTIILCIFAMLNIKYFIMDIIKVKDFLNEHGYEVAESVAGGFNWFVPDPDFEDENIEQSHGTHLTDEDLIQLAKDEGWSVDYLEYLQPIIDEVKAETDRDKLNKADVDFIMAICRAKIEYAEGLISEEKYIEVMNTQFE